MHKKNFMQKGELDIYHGIMAVLDYAFKSPIQDDYIDGKYFSHLCFPDYIILTTDNIGDAQLMTTELTETTKTFGPNIKSGGQQQHVRLTEVLLMRRFKCLQKKKTLCKLDPATGVALSVASRDRYTVL